jgi:hypothetical protein
MVYIAIHHCLKILSWSAFSATKEKVKPWEKVWCAQNAGKERLSGSGVSIYRNTVSIVVYYFTTETFSG